MSFLSLVGVEFKKIKRSKIFLILFAATVILWIPSILNACLLYTSLVRHTQDTILASYLNDMSKYNNLNEIKKTRLAYDNITVQLSKKNTRFQYKLIKKGGRASEFENAIEWLCLSGIVSQVYKVEQVKKPLENYRNIDAFKIYVSDLGLLCAKKDLAANDVLYMVEEINDFKGGMAENYVNVQLTANGYKTYYWESERGAEIDFVIQRDGQLIPCLLYTSLSDLPCLSFSL